MHTQHENLRQKLFLNYVKLCKVCFCDFSHSRVMLLVDNFLFTKHMMNLAVLSSLRVWDVCNACCDAGSEVAGLCFLHSLTGKAVQK